MPQDDRPLQVFIMRAYDALNKCDRAGFILPPEFLAMQPPMVIELDFRP